MSAAPEGLGSRGAPLLDGWRAVRDGRYEDAREAFTGLHSSCPNSPYVLQGLAWAYLLMGNPEGSVLLNSYPGEQTRRFPQMLEVLKDEARRASEQGQTVPRSAGEALLLSHDALYRRDGEEALRLARRADHLTPGNGFVVANLGCCLAFSERWEEALIALRASLPVHPVASTWHNIGVAEWKRGNKKDAVAAWRQALQIVPDFSLSHNALGKVELRRLCLIAAWRHARVVWRAKRAATRAEEMPDV